MDKNSAVNSRRAIFLATYNRVELLDNCLKSIISAIDREKYVFFLIQQGSNENTSEVIKKYRSQIDFIFKVDGKDKTPLQNINYNRVKGYEIAFNELNCEYAIAVEDDTQISKDALVFVDRMMAKFSSHYNFGCVNLLSLGKASEDTQGFSIYRSPLIGQGSAISAELWREFIRNGVRRRIESEPFDGAVEDLVKSKFSIFPNRSRILDRGWEGTHSTDRSDPYFISNEQSWIGDETTDDNYQHIQRFLNLRNDWVPYKQKENLYYLVRKKILDLNRTTYGNFLIRRIRKLLNLASI
jgi:glycosyltransferase involved in cell wall biosynthesis